MANFEWSALVYARTYAVDFRFIANPEGYTSDDLSEIEPYVLASTRLAEELSGQPRWSIFRNEQRCIFGVTCMASDLIDAAGSAGADWATMRRDNTGVRRLYLFAGYVCNNGAAIVPTFDKLNLSLFAPLYRYVAERWFVKAYEESSRIAIETPYKPQEWDIQESAALGAEDASLPSLLISLKKSGEICLIPDADERRKSEIWNTVARQPINASMCFGLSRERDVLDSPLLIASLPVEQEIRKKKTPTVPALEPTNFVPPNISQAEQLSVDQIDNKTDKNEIKRNPSKNEQKHSLNRISDNEVQSIDEMHQSPDEQDHGFIEKCHEKATNLRIKAVNLTRRLFFSPSQKKPKQNSNTAEPPPEILKRSPKQTDTPEKKKDKPRSPWDLD